MTLKEKLHAALLQTIAEKIHRLQENIADLRSGAANETKSTAGDKYETALAMLQIEQDNINRQLQDQMRMRAIAESIDPATVHKKAGPGSVVETDKGVFYICVGLGKLVAEELAVVAISAASPMGQQLSGSAENDSITMNGNSYRITKIC